MRTVVELQDPVSGQIRRIKVGFSWTLLFFASWFGVPLLSRGLFGLGLAFVALCLIGMIAGHLELASITLSALALQLVGSIWLGVKGNEITAKHYLSKGWRLRDPTSHAAQVAIHKWHLHQLGQPQPIVIVRGSVLGKILLGLLLAMLGAGAFLIYAAISDDPLELEVTLNNVFIGDRTLVTVRNKGSKPITIKKVIVNDRTDCQVKIFQDVFFGTKFDTIKLDIGDAALLRSSCGVVRAKFETDQGSSTYSF